MLPVEAIVAKAHAVGAKVLIDGCQAAPRMPVDVQALDCDFYVFSGHKTYGPTGIGVLYGKAELLNEMPPWQGGGDMILSVTFEKTLYNEIPHKFEAGTPDITGVHGLGVALDYIETLGRDRILAHEEALTEYGVQRLSALDGVRADGRRQPAAGQSVVRGRRRPRARPRDHPRPAQCGGPGRPSLRAAADGPPGRAATARASFGVYNTESDIDALIDAVKAAQELFRP